MTQFQKKKIESQRLEIRKLKQDLEQITVLKEEVREVRQMALALGPRPKEAPKISKPLMGQIPYSEELIQDLLKLDFTPENIKEFQKYPNFKPDCIMAYYRKHYTVRRMVLDPNWLRDKLLEFFRYWEKKEKDDLLNLTHIEKRSCQCLPCRENRVFKRIGEPKKWWEFWK